jgi:hypothetical protein
VKTFVLAAAALIPVVGFSLFLKAETPQFYVNITAPAGANIGATSAPALYADSLPSIRSLDIMFYDPDAFIPVPFTNYPSDYSQLGPSGNCWVTGYYTFESPITGLGNNNRRGNTPNP